MSNMFDISRSANCIAAALFRAGEERLLSKIGIDDIRAAVIGYLAAGPYILTKSRTEALIEATLRKTVYKVR